MNIIWVICPEQWAHMTSENDKQNKKINKKSILFRNDSDLRRMRIICKHSNIFHMICLK